jgi:MHS family proline/betaine transporter-like MFS transporter
MGIFASLKREQKEAIGLLQIGTFLEYFDLMIYVHMAMLLNGLFFPKTDPHTADLLTAFAFCSTYALRPFGALLFGYIGDHIGRKSTVVITTLMMSVACLIIANLPTYAQIGITASFAVTACRALQGLSSFGEKKGAEIYLAEITQPPMRYPIVSLLVVSASIGTMAALGIASLFTVHNFNWRIVFWVGAAIAMVGSLARTRLRETPDFVDRKRLMKQAIENHKENNMGRAAELLKQAVPSWKQKVEWKTSLAFLLITCAGPICFYFSFIYCGTLLKNNFGYTAEQVIHHNFVLSIVDLIVLLFFALLSYKIHPLKILKCKAAIYVPFFLLLPLMLSYTGSPALLFLVQAINLAFALTESPAVAVFIMRFPVFRRFTYYGIIAAISSAILNTATAFGFIYITDALGFWGLLCIMLPINLGFLWGLRHFGKLEKASEALQQHPLPLRAAA